MITGRTADAVPWTIERELALIREAIVMVASGRAPRMVVANLRFGEPLLTIARRQAHSFGVRIVPLWGMDDSNSAIAVERVDD